MVEDRVTDGRRIAELLASEIDGRDDDELEFLQVTNADRSATPAVGGTRAFDITIDDDEQRLARVFIHPERAHLEFDRGRDIAAEIASENGLRTRPKAGSPPKTLVFLESGGAVKRGVSVVQAASKVARTEP
ncbi:hypothetical protein ACLI4U_03090 [Natrialbaceae archaeon A-CW2]|uniref:hypothetical protein n=1 Tax=Natronosalvus amylolyticus TaxID=2961994 RepID=UPI0020C9D248|nr:hypothetical protein [Natronosalvus amylolyticus]